MKKKLLFICLFGLLSVTSAYAKCDGGTIVGDFCMSNNPMNWWSAATWCRANERHLATMYEMCPDWDGNGGNGKCPHLNLGKSETIWSSTAYGKDDVWYVWLANGGAFFGSSSPRYGGRERPESWAFCK